MDRSFELAPLLPREFSVGKKGMELGWDTSQDAVWERSCVTLGKDFMPPAQACSYHDYCPHGLLEGQVLGLHFE